MSEREREVVQHLRRITASARAFIRCAEKEVSRSPNPDLRTRSQKLDELSFCYASSVDGHLAALKSSVEAAEKLIAELERLS